MLHLFKSKPLFTENNHFEYGYTENNSQIFEVKFGRLNRQPLTGFEEAVNCARIINENRKDQNISLCISGGVDSEAMLRAFIAAGVGFNIYILKFKDDLNDFDIRTNINLCEKLNLNTKIIDLDVINFLESGEFLKYGQKYKCQSPQLAVHLWLLDQIDGLPVLAGNPFIKTSVNGNTFFIGCPGDLHCAYFRYFELNNRQGAPWFFIYSPELCASFLKLPTAQHLHSLSINPNEYTYSHKCQLYVEAGFNVNPRKDKYTGFERLRDFYDQKLGTSHGVGFDQLFRKPLENLNPFPWQYMQMVPAEYFTVVN